MKKPVCVILGAGASADAWSEGGPVPRSTGLRPPVARELFNFGSRADFYSVARTYPGVQALAAELGELGGRSLEARLREYADDPRDLVKRYFRQVPLYLRDLLVKVTTEYTPGGAHPGNHIRLCLGLLKEHPVAFLDLNYDDYLEEALPVCDGTLAVTSLDDYVKTGRQAIVGKVHGSIHWGTPIAQPPQDESAAHLISEYCNYDPLGECHDLIFQPSRKNTFNWREPDTRRLLFPVLTAPLAGKDHTALVCPKGHLDALKTFLKGCEHYLVIGTSAQDEDLLNFLRSSVLSVQLVHYVNHQDGANACKANFENSSRTFLNAHRRFVFDEGFRAYLSSDHFQNSLNA